MHMLRLYMHLRLCFTFVANCLLFN